MLFIPGLTIFLFSIGFVTKSYWRSAYLFFPPTFLIIIASYYIAKFTLRQWIHKKLANKWFFKIYIDEAKYEPWKSSIILRILMIPADYKNYLIASLDINFL